MYIQNKRGLPYMSMIKKKKEKESKEKRKKVKNI